MVRIRQLLTVVLAAIALVALAACGGGGGGGGGKSGPVEVITHNAVGGGSDVFTRQMIKVMYENKIIDTNWPVRNIPAGDSIGAMSYMVDKKGNSGVIAQVTPTWLATPMTVSNAKVSLADLTPITLVATEPQVVVTNAKSQFNSFADFVAAAKKAPDTLVQAGGSSTANDALTRLVLQDSLGAKWKFLSFEDTGSRITALLRNDANIMLGSASDVAEQVKAGQLKVIAIVGDQRLDTFPDVTTTTEQGIDSSKVPVQFRAVMGAPDMPADAVQKYQDDLSKMVETDDWKALTKDDGLVTQNLQDDKFIGVSEGTDRYRRRPAAGTRPEEGSVTSGGPTLALATFVAEQQAGQIPGPVMHAARRALVDHIGVTVAGSADDATRQGTRSHWRQRNGRGRNGCRRADAGIVAFCGLSQRIRIACARPRRRLQPAGDDRARQLFGVACDPGRRRRPAGQRS